MKMLPAHLNPQQRTDIFTNDTIPKGLLRDHQLKAGTWGKIEVLKGKLSLRFVNEEDDTHVITKGNPGYVPPTKLHQIEASEEVEFFIEFYQ